MARTQACPVAGKMRRLASPGQMCRRMRVIAVEELPEQMALLRRLNAAQLERNKALVSALRSGFR